jgi:hypothetical protein
MIVPIRPGNDGMDRTGRNSLSSPVALTVSEALLEEWKGGGRGSAANSRPWSKDSPREAYTLTYSGGTAHWFVQLL